MRGGERSRSIRISCQSVTSSSSSSPSHQTLPLRLHKLQNNNCSAPGSGVGGVWWRSYPCIDTREHAFLRRQGPRNWTEDWSHPRPSSLLGLSREAAALDLLKRMEAEYSHSPSTLSIQLALIINFVLILQLITLASFSSAQHLFWPFHISLTSWAPIDDVCTLPWALLISRCGVYTLFTPLAKKREEKRKARKKPTLASFPVCCVSTSEARGCRFSCFLHPQRGCALLLSLVPDTFAPYSRLFLNDRFFSFADFFSFCFWTSAFFLFFFVCLFATDEFRHCSASGRVRNRWLRLWTRLLCHFAVVWLDSHILWIQAASLCCLLFWSCQRHRPHTLFLCIGCWSAVLKWSDTLRSSSWLVLLCRFGCCESSAVRVGSTCWHDLSRSSGRFFDRRCGRHPCLCFTFHGAIACAFSWLFCACSQWNFAWLQIDGQTYFVSAIARLCIALPLIILGCVAAILPQVSFRFGPSGLFWFLMVLAASVSTDGYHRLYRHVWESFVCVDDGTLPSVRPWRPHFCCISEWTFGRWWGVLLGRRWYVIANSVCVCCLFVVNAGLPWLVLYSLMHHLVCDHDAWSFPSTFVGHLSSCQRRVQSRFDIQACCPHSWWQYDCFCFFPFISLIHLIVSFRNSSQSCFGGGRNLQGSQRSRRFEDPFLLLFFDYLRIPAPGSAFNYFPLRSTLPLLPDSSLQHLLRADFHYLQRRFGFQVDNARNQLEHASMLLANLFSELQCRDNMATPQQAILKLHEQVSSCLALGCSFVPFWTSLWCLFGAAIF